MATKARRRILVVDDDHECRLLLSALAARAGFEVDAVADGGLALTLLKAKPPDLILLDAFLPRIDGFALLERIRGDAAIKHTPVVMLTAFASEDTRQRGLDAGADEFIEKPFRTEELLELIDQLLKIREARRTLDVDGEALAKGLGNHTTRPRR